MLLNYLMDARAGLGRFRDFRISNYALMMDLISTVAITISTTFWLLPDVRERVDLYLEHAEKARTDQRKFTVRGNLAILDLRREETLWATNPSWFMPSSRNAISRSMSWGLQQQNTVFATGKSILDRSSRTNVGELMLQYGGGGHQAAGPAKSITTRLRPCCRN